MTKREIRELREKIGTDPIFTDEEIEHIWMVMDKAEPMKLEKEWVAFDLLCAGCGNMIGGWEERPNYCPSCGQAIDWED